MSYFDTQPLDIIYSIISYLDKYDINKLINNSVDLIIKFSNDTTWKEMLYHNIKNLVIDINHCWRDNYMDNLDIKSKYNIESLKLNITYDYVFIYRNNLVISDGEIKTAIGRLHFNLQGNRYFTSITYSRSPSSSNIWSIDVNDNQKNKLEKIMDYMKNILRIDHTQGVLVFIGNIYNPFDLSRILNSNMIYGSNIYNNNIISFSFEKLNILLLEAPSL